MTTDQNKAFEILLEIGGDLDYETQFAPLLRFVLEHGEEKETEKALIVTRTATDGMIEAFCSRCGAVFVGGEQKYEEFVRSYALKTDFCPRCHAKFLHE